MGKTKNYAVIDILKLLFAFGIVALHSGFLLNYHYGYYFHTVIFRLGVPFFFMASGYFLSSKIKSSKTKKQVCFLYIKKLIVPYILLSIFYIILNGIRFDAINGSYILNCLWNITILKSPTIMWYVGSLIASVIVILHIKDDKQLKISIMIATILYLIGLSFNTYSFYLNVPKLSFIYSFLINTFSNNSNFIFLGYLYLSLGFYIQKNEKILLKNNMIKIYITFIVSMLFVLFESIIVRRHIGLATNYEYFIGHLFAVPSLFMIAINVSLNINTKLIRDLSTNIYYYHYAVIVILILLSKNNQSIIMTNTNINYIITIIITLLFSLAMIYAKKIIRKRRYKNER